MVIVYVMEVLLFFRDAARRLRVKTWYTHIIQKNEKVLYKLTQRSKSTKEIQPPEHKCPISSQYHYVFSVIYLSM